MSSLINIRSSTIIKSNTVSKVKITGINNINNVCFLKSDGGVNSGVEYAVLSNGCIPTFLGTPDKVLLSGIDIDITNKHTVPQFTMINVADDDTTHTVYDLVLCKDGEYEYADGTFCYDIVPIKKVDPEKVQDDIDSYNNWKESLLLESLVYSIVGFTVLYVIGFKDGSFPFLMGGLTNQVYLRLLQHDIDNLGAVGNQQTAIPRGGLTMRLLVVAALFYFIFREHNEQVLLFGLLGFNTGKVAMIVQSKRGE